MMDALLFWSGAGAQRAGGSFVDFHPVEHLDKLGVTVVHDLAVADVELCDLCHILVAELEVSDGQVLLHAILVDGLRDDGDAALDVPPQGHLGGALAVFLADGGQHGMGEDAVAALGKGTPCFGMDAVLLHQRCGRFAFVWNAAPQNASAPSHLWP